MHNNVFMDTGNKMPCYKVEDEDVEKAEAEFNARFNNTNLINKRTVYDRKESRIGGILGEIIFKKLYPSSIKSIGDITYDFDYEGFKVDVKCKCRSVNPNPNFQASFFMYQANKTFNADMYYFMSTTHSLGYVWLCGVATKADIMSNPYREIWKKGMTDPSNGMYFKEDTIAIKYKYLTPVDIDKIY